MRKSFFSLLMLVGVLIMAAGCGSAGTVEQAGSAEPAGTGGSQSVESRHETAGTYTQISQEEARTMMESEDGHIVVDVRRQDEYDSGHIPGAVCIPNESIGEVPPAELSDPDQVVLIYCRTGRRSKEAAQKLADLGYSNIYEFGGIVDWTGEITTD